jgi:nicotinate phosphoribosyltransferase
MRSDLLTLDSDAQPGTPLLQPVMRNGRRLPELQTLSQARERAQAELLRLPEPLRRLEAVDPYPVQISDRLRELADEVDRARARVD